MRAIKLISLLFLLTACSQGNDVLRIAEQGSFAVGGTVLTDSLGRTYHGDHAYVSIKHPLPDVRPEQPGSGRTHGRVVA